MTIHVLAPDVAAKIAAGEVVERPANAIKELLENSLDAGATEIRVEIREGGTRSLRVMDNGHGILAAEAPLAFARHATSKLETADDLTRVATFGFRGEALYSIAAVSHVTLTTRHQDESFATQLRLEGGNVVEQSRTGAPVGTVLHVEHLFFNTPARRKFLRAAATEAGRINTTIQHFALAYPHVRFSLVNEGRLVFQSTGTGDLFDVLVKVFGLENAKQMAPIGVTAATKAGSPDADLDLFGDLDDEVDFMSGSSAAAPAQPNPTGEIIQVGGYVSLPSLTRANRSNIHLFVNRRYIEDKSLTHAVVQAYHTLLPGGRFPLAVILMDVSPAQVDVNVHPQKTQVRFVDERKLYRAVQRVVRRAVVNQAGVPDIPMGETARRSESGGPGEWHTLPDEQTGPGAQQPFDLFVPGARPGSPPGRESTAASPADQTGQEPISSSTPAVDATSPQQQPTQEPAERQVELDGGRRTLPPLRVVGQVGAMYIVAEGPEGLFLIDQHAAHERILYEKFMAQRYGMPDGAVAQQQLLEPLTLHAGSQVAGLVADHLEKLQRIGFGVEPFGGDTFLVRAVPSVLSGEDPLRSLEEIVGSLADRRNLVGEELEARLVKMVCKRAAIKAGQQLSVIEMQELVRQLEECQSPRTCPHGRPTMIQLSAGELEKAFGRI